MDFMTAFGVASVMLCLGMVIRAKVPFVSKMLVPSSVIAGIVGFLLVNSPVLLNTDTSVFNTIVQQLFVVSFISIGLTGKSEKEAKNSDFKAATRGAFSMGMVWNLLYALTPVIGALIVMLIGSAFDMNPVYGLLIPFAFTQGPGQASTFGAIFEQYGWANASMVGVTFSAVGFLAAFLVGVPLARYGLKKGLAKSAGQSYEFIERGYYNKEDVKGSMGEETTFSGNIDTMTIHFALIGISYLLAVVFARVISYIPGIGPTISSMLFLLGMLAAYLVKYMMKMMKVDHLIDNQFQSKITGWSADYLVVASFMAVQLNVIGEWIVPILIISFVVTIVTFIISVYFGRRIGDENDFERTLGLYGTSTGTVPSGIALVRIIDPTLNTTTAMELGMMNIPMLFSMVTLTTLLAIANGQLTIMMGLLLLLLPIPVYLIVLKVAKVWNKPSYKLGKEESLRAPQIVKEKI